MLASKEWLTAWFEENLTYENFKNWDDKDFAEKLLEDLPSSEVNQEAQHVG